MIYAIQPPQIAAHAAHLVGAQLAMVVASIAAGNTAGQLWATDAGDAVLLWDKGNNVLYLAGERADKAEQRAVATLIATHIRPQAIDEGRTRFKARTLSAAWETALPALFAGVVLRPSATLFYGYTAAVQPAPTGVSSVMFEPIDRTLLERGDLLGSAPVREELAWMWPALDLFYERGVGQVAIADGTVVCWCTSEYVSATMCGIGIATEPDYQRRGIATAAAQRFVAQAQGRGLTPYWECSGENIASQRTAEKVGFALIECATYWIGSFAP